MIWEELGDFEEGEMVYQRVDHDGKVRITAVKGYPELDEYLAQQEVADKKVK